MTERKLVQHITTSDRTLSALQTHLEQLMVVIIDEISMIGAQTLYKIHMCLQEIKGLH